MALDAMRRAYATDPVKEMLEARFKAELAENTRMNVAIKRSKAEGEAKGKAEGARLANVQNAKRMQALGMSAEQIEQITDLKPEDY